MGVRSVFDVAAAAFLSSSFSTRQLQTRILRGATYLPPGIQSALADFNARVSGPDGAAAGEGDVRGALTADALAQDPPSHRDLVGMVDRQTWALLRQRSSQLDNARMLSAAMIGAADWLEAVPLPWHSMSSRDFSTAVRLRLGLPQHATSHICPSCRKEFCDILGHHALSCSSDGDRIHRHNAIRDDVRDSCRRAQLNPRREPRHLLEESGEKPADVWLPTFDMGREAALDVVCTSPCTDSVYRQAASQQGFAAAQAEAAKRHKSLEKCEQAGILFLPVAVEVFGGWGETALAVIRRIGSLLAEASGRSRSAETRYLRQRLSLRLQRCNAAMVQARGA